MNKEVIPRGWQKKRGDVRLSRVLKALAFYGHRDH